MNTTSSRSRLAGVSSYAPELLDLWRKAATQTVTIRFKLEERGDATHFRQRLYRLRSALKRENHALSKLAERATIRLLPEVDDGTVIKGWLLIVQPTDDKYMKKLREAGLEGEEPPSLD